MTAAEVSVIVVSRHRPAALKLCLGALALQDHPRFELIVVADPTGIVAAQETGLALKTVTFDEPNISAARNLGLSQAAAPIVAFIDDDAIADPVWLSRLIAPFAEDAVIASTGFVRGRNGISFQWQACEVDASGFDHPLPAKAEIRQGTPGRAVKTQGTNCAFRRSALIEIGGFDPALKFYLDEADVNLRLATRGLTAIVPQAQVHHGFAASAQRSADRIPLTLHEIAASIAVFLRRHAPQGCDLESIPAIAAQVDRVDRLRSAGRITHLQAAALKASLATGWDDGMARPLGQFPALDRPAPAFLPVAGTGPRPGRLIAGRAWQKARLRRLAAKAVAQGEIVTVLCLSPSPRAHRVQFLPDRIWWQSGGLFGCTDRAGPRFRLTSFRARVLEEANRIASQRPSERVEMLSLFPRYAKRLCAKSNR